MLQQISKPTAYDQRNKTILNAKTATRVVLYARVSTEKQASGDKVSIGRQLADMEALCERQGWQIVGTFKDHKKYKKTRPPYRGKVKDPSGEYDDRPGFMAMLEVIETGQVDVVLYWDNYRLGRHYRVLGTFLNALETGEKGLGQKIQIWEAANGGAIVDRFVLGIKIGIGKEENEARKRRIKMGLIGTLEQGRWPSKYDRLGYDSIKEEGKRGRKIILASDQEVQLAVCRREPC
jgi:DNA invertase Pin-like site-specific DNA recombinase